MSNTHTHTHTHTHTPSALAPKRSNRSWADIGHSDDEEEGLSPMAALEEELLYMRIHIHTHIHIHMITYMIIYYFVSYVP